MYDLTQIIFHFLSLHQITFSKLFIEKRLKSHPDFPSLLAIKETLEELGIKSNAYLTDIEQLKTLKQPFLAHCNQGGGLIFSIDKYENANQLVPDFDKNWSGAILLIESKNTITNAAHNKQYKTEKQIRFFETTTMVLIFAFALFLSIYKNNLAALLLLLNNAAGLYFSWLIV